MTEISVSERRLSAALDRIDQFLEAGLGRSRAPVSEPDAGGADLRARLEAAEDRLTALARANDELIAANHALAGASPSDAPDATRQALEAEIAALRAARSAEVAQLGQIMAELEDFIGSGILDAKAEMGDEMMGDGGGLPEGGSEAGAGAGAGAKEGNS